MLFKAAKAQLFNKSPFITNLQDSVDLMNSCSAPIDRVVISQREVPAIINQLSPSDANEVRDTANLVSLLSKWAHEPFFTLSNKIAEDKELLLGAELTLKEITGDTDPIGAIQVYNNFVIVTYEDHYLKLKSK